MREIQLPNECYTPILLRRKLKRIIRFMERNETVLVRLPVNGPGDIRSSPNFIPQVHLVAKSQRKKTTTRGVKEGELENVAYKITRIY